MHGQGTPDYIVIEGPIGVGKTSLARRLAASFDSDLLLEEAEENPFLDRFYRDPAGAALPTQLFFLFQRVRQLNALVQNDLFRPVTVSDFLIQKDRLFAELTLDADELALYEQVWTHLAPDPPPPDLVVYLQAPAEVLMRRIRLRGLSHEQGMSLDYLEALVESYTRFFHDFDAAPLLIVNAADIDPINDDRDYKELFEAICAMERGRQYFNPVAHSDI